MPRDNSAFETNPKTAVVDSPLRHKRLKNEAATISAMIRIYCNDHHGSTGTELCPKCQELLEYARKRLNSCPFQEQKPTCGKCTVHCYKKSMREQVKAVMRYAGPRMIYRHPVMALQHLIDGRRPTPPLRKNKNNKQ